MFFCFLFVRKQFFYFWCHMFFCYYIIIIILESNPFLFGITKNYRQQNIPLDSNISFALYEFIYFRNFLPHHGGKIFLCPSPLSKFLLKQSSWMLMFHCLKYNHVNNYIILWNSELQLYNKIKTKIKSISLIPRNSELSIFSLFPPIISSIFSSVIFTHSTKQWIHFPCLLLSSFSCIR